MSPNGELVAFTDTRLFSGITTEDLWVYTLATGQANKLTSNMVVRNISWLSDGQEIVFADQYNLRGKIYRINVDGSGLVKLTPNLSYDDAPVLSPSGDMIVFHSIQEGQEGINIWVMNINGSHRMQLTHAVVPSDFNPQWSPDGSKIVYERYYSMFDSEIWIVEVNEPFNTFKIRG